MGSGSLFRDQRWVFDVRVERAAFPVCRAVPGSEPG